MSTTLQQLPAKVSIKIYKGDDFSIKIKRFADETKTTLVNMTGYSAELRIADSKGVLLDTLSTTDNSIVLTDGTGTYNIELKFLKDRVDAYTWKTGEYDFSITDSLNMTRTFFRGAITVQKDV